MKLRVLPGRAISVGGVIHHEGSVVDLDGDCADLLADGCVEVVKAPAKKAAPAKKKAPKASDK